MERGELTLAGSGTLFGNWLMWLISRLGDTPLGEVDSPDLRVDAEIKSLYHMPQSTLETARQRVTRTTAKLTGNIADPYNPDVLGLLHGGGRAPDIQTRKHIGVISNKPPRAGKEKMTIHATQGAIPSMAALQTAALSGATDGGTGGGGTIPAGTYHVWGVPVYENPVDRYTAAYDPSAAGGKRGWDYIYGNPSDSVSVEVAAGSSTIAVTGLALSAGSAAYEDDLTATDLYPTAVVLLVSATDNITASKPALVVPAGNGPGDLPTGATILALGSGISTTATAPVLNDGVLVETVVVQAGIDKFTKKTPGVDYVYNPATGELTFPEGSTIDKYARLRVTVWTVQNSSVAFVTGSPAYSQKYEGLLLRNFETESTDAQNKSVLGAEVLIPRVNAAAISGQLLRASREDFMEFLPFDFDLLRDEGIGGFGLLTVYNGRLRDYWQPLELAA